MLVTGAGGFVGGAVVRRLVDAGQQVRALVRRAGTPADQALRSLTDDVAVADLLAPDAGRRAVEGVEVVVHAAAGMRGADADRYRSTVIGTRNLFDGLDGTTVRRVVLISSLAVYATHDLPSGATIDEHTGLEPHPERRSPYVLAKLDQEAVARRRAGELGVELVVLRPGVVYGPGALEVSDRVGLEIGRWLLVLGAAATLPLSYIDNCADAVAVACDAQVGTGTTVNVQDDDLPTGREYLALRRRALGPTPTIPVPYPLLLAASGAVEWYHRRSKGQLPAVVTPYGVVSRYRDFRYSNAALTALGWAQGVSTTEGLQRSFAAARTGTAA